LKETAVPDSTPNPAARQRFGIVFTVALLLAAAGVSYLGVRDSWAVAPRPDPAPAHAEAPPEVELPPGPHRAEFQTACLICHSARLALNQPPFKAEKWAEIVLKMVNVYGASISKDDQARIVEYLMAVEATR
jgi:hypothetical protein